MHALTWLAGWLADVERCSCIMKKCVFLTKELVYMGFVISNEGLKMDYEKVRIILEFPTPRCTFDVRRFHGLMSFYKKFIENFSEKCALLIECMKNEIFGWTSTTMKSFEDLK
jgi:hypothetical protein